MSCWWCRWCRPRCWNVETSWYWTVAGTECFFLGWNLWELFERLRIWNWKLLQSSEEHLLVAAREPRTETFTLIELCIAGISDYVAAAGLHLNSDLSLFQGPAARVEHFNVACPELLTVGGVDSLTTALIQTGTMAAVHPLTVEGVEPLTRTRLSPSLDGCRDLSLRQQSYKGLEHEVLFHVTSYRGDVGGGGWKVGGCQSHKTHLTLTFVWLWSEITFIVPKNAPRKISHCTSLQFPSALFLTYSSTVAGFVHSENQRETQLKTWQQHCRYIVTQSGLAALNSILGKVAFVNRQTMESSVKAQRLISTF